MHTVGHFLYYSFDPWNFITNISAGLVVLPITYVAGKYAVIPKIKEWHKHELEEHHKRIVEEIRNGK